MCNILRESNVHTLGVHCFPIESTLTGATTQRKERLENLVLTGHENKRNILCNVPSEFM